MAKNNNVSKSKESKEAKQSKKSVPKFTAVDLLKSANRWANNPKAMTSNDCLALGISFNTLAKRLEAKSKFNYGRTW